MNFLQLVQRATQESGTVNTTGVPAAVTGQTQLRYIRIIDFVAQAWTDIQNMHGEWLWMRAESTGNTVAGTSAYTAGDWSVSARFAEWIIRDYGVSMYLASTGVSDEGDLSFIDWDTYRRKYGRGSQTNNRPIEYSIGPDRSFNLGPIPDDTYTVRFPYQKNAQTLAANTDTPELPTRFHSIIWRKALLALHAFDESAFAIGATELFYNSDLEALERDQLPKMTIGAEPLA